MSTIKILYYGRTDISEGLDVSKTRESKECDICHTIGIFQIKVQVLTKCLKVLIIPILLVELAKVRP